MIEITIVVRVQEDRRVGPAVEMLAKELGLSSLQHDMVLDAIQEGAICTEIMEKRAKITEKHIIE